MFISVLIGLPGRPNRGPLCFDCQHVESVEECGTVSLCHHDQVYSTSYPGERPDTDTAVYH